MVSVNNQEYESENIPELAREFKTPVAKLKVTESNSGWFSRHMKRGDKSLTYIITDARGIAEYLGEVLIRDGRVHFYDRYPMGGGPYKLDDFNDEEFRNRAKLISRHIEKLIGTK